MWYSIILLFLMPPITWRPFLSVWEMFCCHFIEYIFNAFSFYCSFVHNSWNFVFNDAHMYHMLCLYLLVHLRLCMNVLIHIPCPQVLTLFSTWSIVFVNLSTLFCSSIIEFLINVLYYFSFSLLNFSFIWYNDFLFHCILYLYFLNLLRKDYIFMGLLFY